MTCITYFNGVMMADRLSVVDNNSVPIIVDATKLFVSKKVIWLWQSLRPLSQMTMHNR